MTLSVRIVGGVLLILLGIAWLLQSAGLVHFPPGIIAPAALIAIGIALVAGSHRGMHTGLLVAGIVLTIVLASDHGQDRSRVTLRRQSSNRVVTPTSASQLRPYRLEVGNLTIDLTHLPVNEPVTYRVSARVDAGRLQVFVPSGMSTQVTARSGAGRVDLFGRTRSGVGTRTTTTFDYPGRAKFVLSLRTGVGSIIARHRPAMSGSASY